MAQTTPELEAVIQRYISQLEKMKIHIERVMLFGSRADGTAHEDSDIDLIVVSRDWARFNNRERLEMLGIAAGRILEPIEAIGFTPEEIETHQLSSFWEMTLKEQAVAV
jgi:predicted nucleotidyltransferase